MGTVVYPLATDRNASVPFIHAPLFDEAAARNMGIANPTMLTAHKMPIAAAWSGTL